MMQFSHRVTSSWLWLLTGLFGFRVLAQLLVANVDVAFLPSFERWHSATMPYAMLLLIQVVILAVMGRTNTRYATQGLKTRPRLGRGLLVFGVIYLLGMLLRLVLGLTLYTGHPWFSKVIPTIFHLVLALWVLSIGWIYFHGTSKPHA